MRRQFCLIGVCALTLLVASPALADSLRKGQKEINFDFSYSKLEGDDSNQSLKTTLLTGMFGYMLTDGHEVGGILQYSKSEISGSASSDSTLFGAFYHYNFQAGPNINPYLGANLATIGGDLGDVFDTAYGIEGGVKVWPWSNGGFQFGVRYTKYQGADNFEDGTETALFGGVGIKF